MNRLWLVSILLAIANVAVAQYTISELSCYPYYDQIPNKKEVILSNKIKTVTSIIQHYLNDTLGRIDTSITLYDINGNVLSYKTILTFKKTEKRKERRLVNILANKYDEDNRDVESNYFKEGEDSSLIFISNQNSYDQKGNLVYCKEKTLNSINLSSKNLSSKNIVIYNRLTHTIEWKSDSLNKNEAIPIVDSNKSVYISKIYEYKYVYDKKNRHIETYNKSDSGGLFLVNRYEYDRKGRLTYRKSKLLGASTFEYDDNKIIEYSGRENVEPKLARIALLNNQKQVVQVFINDYQNKLNKDLIVSAEYSFNPDGTMQTRTRYNKFRYKKTDELRVSKEVETFFYQSF